LTSLRDVLHYRDLMVMLTWRDICVRYKQSILGICWAVLMPTVIVLAGVVVKLAQAKVAGAELRRDDLALVTIKAVPWAFFVATIRACTGCLVGNSNLVTRIRFPKVILPLSAVLSQLFDLGVALIAAAIVLLCVGVAPAATILWVPALLVLLVVLAAGLGMFLAAAGLFFRDVRHLVEVVVTFAIFFTPVFFETRIFQDWADFLLLNPVAPLLEALAAATLGYAGPDLTWVAYSGVVSLLILAGSYTWFCRVEPAFAECI
jgi:ABC-type polysaccharide/polyol phosphate export permease